MPLANKPDQDKELTQFDEKAQTTLTAAHAIAIADDEQYAEVGAYLLVLKSYQKELDKTFDDPIRAARESLEAIRGAKDRHSGPIKEAEVLIKRKLSEYKDKRELALAEQNKKALDLAAKTGDIKALAKPAELPKVSGVSYRKMWTAEVVNMVDLVKAVAEGKAQITFLAVENSELNRFGEATKGQIPVPGVVFRQKEVVSGRAT